MPTTPRTTMANPYQQVPNWPRLGTIKPGAAIGIIPDGAGGIWMLHRSEPPIVRINAAGEVIAGFAGGMISSGHGFCRDRAGNFWVGDSGVFFDLKEGADPKAYVFRKFSPDGKLLLTFGKPGVSKAGTDTMIMPTACALMPNGNLMLADGHLPRPSYAQHDTDRLLEITTDGKFVRQWGNDRGRTDETGTRPGEFWSPHALAYDSQGRLFVADRTNNRVEIFDKDMNFLDDWKHFGRPSGLIILQDDTIVVSDSESSYPYFRPAELGPDPRPFKDPGNGRPGFISPLTNPYSLTGYTGQNTFYRNNGWQNGIRIGSAKDGSLKYFIEGIQPEGLGADDNGNIVYAGLTGQCSAPGINCLQKWVKK